MSAGRPGETWDGSAWRRPGEPAVEAAARALWEALAARAGAIVFGDGLARSRWDDVSPVCQGVLLAAVADVLDALPAICGIGQPGGFSELDRLHDAHAAALAAGDRARARGFAC